MENMQDIIVYIIIGIALIIAGYHLVKRLTGKKSACSDCSSDCSGCAVQELKKNIEEAQKTKNQKQAKEK